MAEGPIVLCRVDPRLVHSTVVNAWVPTVNAQQLLVADQAVAADDRRRNIVEIAAIDVDRVLFSAAADAAEVLGQSTARTIVLFSTIQAAEQALAAGLPFRELHVGHMPDGPGRTQYLPAVFLGEDELAAIRRLQARGVQVKLQSLPDDAPMTIGEEPPIETESDHAEGEFEIVNERGLHLRAAHVLAGLCNKYRDNEVEVGRDDFMVNAKSLLGLTALGAAAGTRLKVVVTGPNAPVVLEALRALFAGGFDEGVAVGRKGGE